MADSTTFGDMNGAIAYFGPAATGNSRHGAAPLRLHTEEAAVFGDISGPLTYWGALRLTGAGDRGRRIAA